MRVIIEAFGRAFILQYGKLDEAESEPQVREFEHAPPHDPHGTLSCQVEQGPGAEAFVNDVVAAGKFGFGHGR